MLRINTLQQGREDINIADNPKNNKVMLTLGTMVSSSSTKNLAANTAATVSKAASAGKQNTADTSCHKLSKRDLAYFSSERFANTLKSIEDRELASSYGQLIARRKKAANLPLAWKIVDAIIYVDIYDAHWDGFNYSYEEVRDLFKGYRSQALREMKSARGFNALVYRELARTLEDRREIRAFLKSINVPTIKVQC